MTTRFFFSAIPGLLGCLTLFSCYTKPQYPVEAEKNVARVQVGASASTRFSTLDDALAAVQAGLARGAAVELILADGVHHLDKPIELTPAFSGTESKPLRIRSETLRGAVLSGAQPVQLDWQSWKDGIWVAALDASPFDRLFISGQPRIRARYPNFDAAKKPYGGYAADAILAKRTARWKTPETGYLHALHDGRWGGWHYPISGRNDRGEIIPGQGTGNNRPSEPHALFRYVENNF